MTDEPTTAPALEEPGITAPATPTPQELLAETQADDPEVGADGIGMGELP